MSGFRITRRPHPALTRQAKRGFRGYPVGTIACDGPDATRASKVAVAIVRGEGQEASEIERWFSDAGDVRFDTAITRAVIEFLQAHAVRSVVISDGRLGCPHEEGIDYPEGEVCPQCPYWAGRDRLGGDD